MILTLKKQQVLELGRPATSDGRRLSIGSNTDADMHRVNSFAQKAVGLQGEPLDVAQDGIGYACKKGKKPESPNQDSFFIMKVEGQCSVYGVFDGHGHKGHDISNFIKENLPKLLLQQPNLKEDPLTALSVTFEKTQQLIVQATKMKMIDASQSGSTVSVIYHDLAENVLHVAHVGDSRCVLGKYKSEASEANRWSAYDLTVDHKPNMPEERARIEAAGGRVIYDGGWNYRVYARNHRGPGLNMSRAMGDLVGFFHAGISASPDVQSHNVVEGDDEEEVQASKTDDGGAGTVSRATSSSASVSSYKLSSVDKFVLLCSDGVWEFLTSEEAVKAVGQYEPEDAMQAAEHLAALSWDRWIGELAGQVVDDITAVVVNLNVKAPQG